MEVLHMQPADVLKGGLEKVVIISVSSGLSANDVLDAKYVAWHLLWQDAKKIDDAIASQKKAQPENVASIVESESVDTPPYGKQDYLARNQPKVIEPEIDAVELPKKGMPREEPRKNPWGIYEFVSTFLRDFYKARQVSDEHEKKEGRRPGSLKEIIVIYGKVMYYSLQRRLMGLTPLREGLLQLRIHGTYAWKSVK